MHETFDTDASFRERLACALVSCAPGVRGCAISIGDVRAGAAAAAMWARVRSTW